MSRFQNNIFFLKNKLFRHNAMRHYWQALKQQKLSYDQLSSLNWEKRKKIVGHAYKHIPFYKKYYDSMGFTPDLLKTESDWIKVPALEKEMVRQFKADIKDPDLDPQYFGIATTGGSTGMPLKVYIDKRFNTEILGWRAFSWWNVSPAANVGIIHRNVPATIFRKFVNRALWWPTKRIYLNASSFNEKDLSKFVSNITRKKIVWLVGYTGGLEKAADFILENNIKINSLKLVWSTSSPLYKNVRIKLEKAFGCKVMNQYGCNEIANIAIQCPYTDDLHINYDYVHIDVVDSDGHPLMEKEGDILVSNLQSFAFPLIKYRLGDRGTLTKQKCNCGNSLPLLKEIKGRISDAAYTPNGIYLDGIYLSSIFDNYTDYIDQFQVYQNKDYSLRVSVKVHVPTEKTLEVLSAIKETLEEKVQHEIPISIDIVDRIHDDRGKIRYIISEIALSKLQEL